MKINLGTFFLITFALIFIIGLVVIGVHEREIVKQMKLFCKDVGGKYDFKDCLIKEDGYYQRYDIAWEWNEKGVREFYLVRE